MASHVQIGRHRLRLRNGLTSLLVVAALSSCATPQDLRVPEADRTWHCALSRPLPHGRIEGSATLNRAGTRRDSIRLVWRRQVSAYGSIELEWYAAEGTTEPNDAAQALLAFRIGPSIAGLRRLELRRAMPDGAAGEIVFASMFERRPNRVYARWGDVRAASRDGAFLAVVTDRQGNIHAQTRVERDVVAEPSRAAAMLLTQMSAMIANHEQSCQLSSDREERILIT